MEEKIENGKIVKREIGEGFLHEARKKFKTIQEAIEAACGNSYSLSESDINILYDVSSIEEAEEIIEEYYDANEDRWNLPSIGTVFSYDDPKNGLQIVATEKPNESAKYAEHVKDTEYADYAVDQYPNAIAYSTSTGTNQLVIREEVDDKGETFYRAIYCVASNNLLQNSSAMQAFHKDGWECRCIQAEIIEQHNFDGNILDTSNYGKNVVFMFDSELSPEVIESLTEMTEEDEVYVEVEDLSSDADGGKIIESILSRFGKVTQLEEVSTGYKNVSYEFPEKITGAIYKGAVCEREEYDGELLGAYVALREIQPIAIPCKNEWEEFIQVTPPSEELLRAMDEEAKKNGADLWIDADRQLQIAETIIEESKKRRKEEIETKQEAYTPQDIAEGILARQGEIDVVLNETIQGAKLNEEKGHDGQTQAD